MTFQNPLFRMAALAACTCFSHTALLHAQITATAPAVAGVTEGQRFDIFGGASYSHFNPGYAHQVRALNLLGWEGSVTGWFTNLVGLEGTVRGLYGTYDLPANAAGYGVTATTSPMSEHLFLFGPSFRLYQSQKYTAGAHVLVGGTYGSFDKAFQGTGIQPYTVGVYNNQLASAYAIGGWADYKLSPRFAIRFTGDYQPTRYSKIGQNEFFGAVGVVYKIGHRK